MQSVLGDTSTTNPSDKLLKGFAEAVIRSNGRDMLGIAAARDALAAAAGDLATISAALVIAQFDGINKVADMSGVKYVYTGREDQTVQLTEALNLDPPKFIASPGPTTSRL